MHQLPLLALAATFSVPAISQSTAPIDADRDNTLYEEGLASNGAGTRMFTGRRLDGQRRRAVVRFDVAGAIPAGATIVSAALELEVVRTISGPSTHTLHRTTSDWGEGASFAPSGQGFGTRPQAGDTTWTERMFPGVLWTTPGGDFVATASSMQSLDGLGRYTFPSTTTLVADVQSWLDTPATNYGWLVLGDESLPPPSAKAIGTHENTTAAPRLLVAFTLPAAATPFGTSCQTGSAPLVLAAQGVPTIGSTSFGLAITGGSGFLTRRDCLFGRGSVATPVPVLGCELWLDPARLLPVCIPFDPVGTIRIGIPNDPSLSGEMFHAQGIATDLSSGGGVITSNGVELRIGT